MTTSLSPGRRLREQWSQGIVQIPGVFNALVARMAEQIGFTAVYLSGGALSASRGVPDVGLLTMPEFIDAARSITHACSLPLVCDSDTGFGETINVERTVRFFEEVGVAGIHLEDQRLPKRCGHLSGKQLVEPNEMISKIRAAVSAKTDPDFVIIARTDARGVNGFDDAVARAEQYLEAGADAIFPEAMQNEAEFAKFAERIDAPLLANMTEFGKSELLDLQVLSDMGYKIVIYPLTAFRVAMRAAQETLAEIREKGHQRDKQKSMLNREDLYKLLGYSDYEERDRQHFT